MSHSRWLMAAMVVSVLLVALGMFFDEQREFESAVEAFKEEQRALVTAVAADFETRLQRMAEVRDPGHAHPEARALIHQLLGGATELEQPRSRILLVSVPGKQGLLRTDGRFVASNALRAAFAASAETLTMSRDAAEKLGLPPRIAIAAIRKVVIGDEHWGVIVVASAERLRTRERHAQLRFLLGLLVVTLLVAGFGGLALRDQNRKLVVARELEMEAFQRERERLLVQADKMATLAALSGGIAHQLATPLGTIIARVEQVLPAVAELPKATSSLRIIAEQVVRIQRIISGVLDLARGNRPTLVRARPEAIIEGALSLVRHRLKQAAIGVELAIDPALPSIACDPPMLEQALVNLLLNACEASGRDSTIWISVQMHLGALRVIVDDEGEGISGETAARAGEPFFTTKSKERGTGLGLAIAQEVIANHGGKLTLERRESAAGTRAAIELPLS